VLVVLLLSLLLSTLVLSLQGSGLAGAKNDEEQHEAALPREGWRRQRSLYTK
jgi:hypothetical protein